MTNDKIKELEAFKNSTFIPLFESDETKLGIYGDFYAVNVCEIIDTETECGFRWVTKCFGTAAEALEFYNKQNNK